MEISFQFITYIAKKMLYLRCKWVILMCFFIFVVSPKTNAQNTQYKLDSIDALLNKLQHDTSKLYFLERFVETIQDDSVAQIYNQKAEGIANKNVAQNISDTLKKTYKMFLMSVYYRIGYYYSSHGNYGQALNYNLKALQLSEELKNKEWISRSFNNIGNAYADQGFYDKALEYYQKALKIDEAEKNNDGISMCCNNIGLVYTEQGLYNKAITYYLRALKINEASGNKMNLSGNYTNLGLVHYDQRNYEKAIEYFTKSLQIDTELGDKYGISAGNNNLGLVYADQKMFDKAIDHYLKSSKISEEIQDKRGLAKCFNNIGFVFFQRGDYKNANIYYLNSLKLGEELGDKNGIATVWSNLSSLNITIADSTILTKNEKNYHFNEAIKYGLKSYELAKEINAIPKISAAAAQLQTAYKRLGNTTKSLEYAEIYIATKDSMFNDDKMKALAGMEAKYKEEKKQLEYDKLAKEKELQNSELKKQRIIILFMISGLLFIALISIILFRLFLHKKKANNLLKQLNSELNQKNDEISAQRDEIENQRDEILTVNETLKQQKEEIEAQRDEIEVQRDVATTQRDQITHQKKELTDSINYAQRIQHAILPPDYYVAKCLAEHFILYLPKDVVSGDFYFVEKLENNVIFCAVDCTGHGVPGAMMSVIGYNLLNQAVKLNKLTKPSEILGFLDAGVTDTLRQTMGESGVNDGMDIAVCTLNTETLMLQYAGAYNSVVLIQNGTMNEIKADNLAIGVNYDGVIDEYKNHEIQLVTGDCIYMYSDGYADQFGGPKGKKFKYKQLKDLLVANHQKPIAEQKEILISEFKKWQGDLEQVDDVMMIGVKI